MATRLPILGAAIDADAAPRACLIQARQRRHDGFGLLDDDHLPGGGNHDELGAGNAAAKCFAICRGIIRSAIRAS